MISPLEGGGRRHHVRPLRPVRPPSTAAGDKRRPSEPVRRGFAGRALAVLAGLVMGIATWLTVGVSDTSEPHTAPASFTRAPRASERPPKPAMAASTVALDRPDSLNVELSEPPRAGLLFDVDSGEVLWRRDAGRRLPVASLTKIMTALIAVDRLPPDRLLKVPPGAIGSGDSAVGLPEGRRVEVESLLAATLIQSAGDAARTLAIGASGSQAGFVRLMNARAERLGLRCTAFASPDGLSAANRSCPADLAALTRLAMEEPRITRLVRKPRAIVPVPIPGGEQHLASTNPLLETGYSGTIGLKTGYTETAGSCLVAVVRRGGRTLGAVVIDSRDPNRDARALFDKAFGESGDGAAPRR